MFRLFLILAVIALTACTDAQRASLTSLGKTFDVKLYAVDGRVIAEWHTTGAVTNEGSSDGFVFVDRATGKNIEVSGTLIITQE